MSKNTNNTDRQGFYNHLEAMKNHEKDVDAFLAANRLERHESTRKHANPLAVAGVCGVSAIACTGLVLGYISGYFVPALIGAGAIAFIGCVFLAISSCK